MYRYGQYCPIAQAVEILGDRWTLLIVRDLLTGTCHFNDLERGLPGISRGLLANRLRRLEEVGILEKGERPSGRRRTIYQLTAAGQALAPVIDALLIWGARWAFDQPADDQLNPILLLWWMRDRVCHDRLPAERVVIRFDFTGAAKECYWLILTRSEASVCLTHPGFDINLLVTADLAALFQVWMGRISFQDAQADGRIVVDGIPRLTRGFPDWFAYSLAAPAVRQAVVTRAAAASD